jgi:hypothetical protein
VTRPPTHPQDAVVPGIDEPPDRAGRSFLDRARSRLDAIRRHRRRSPRLHRNSGRGLVVLIGLVAILSAAVLIVGRIDAMRLSGSAAVHITSVALFGGSAYDQSPSGSTIHYTYSVDGRTYSGVDFREWLDVAAHDPKVCFDPSNPARHLLVEGGHRCGT